MKWLKTFEIDTPWLIVGSKLWKYTLRISSQDISDSLFYHNSFMLIKYTFLTARAVRIYLFDKSSYHSVDMM